MIQPQSYLNVADNSGARKLMCIRVLNKNQSQFANIGDIIVAVVKEAIPNMPLKKSGCRYCAQSWEKTTKKHQHRSFGQLSPDYMQPAALA